MYGKVVKTAKFCIYTVLRVIFLLYGWVVSFDDVDPELAWQSWLGMILVTAVISAWQYFATKAYLKPKTSYDPSRTSVSYTPTHGRLQAIAIEKRTYMYQMFDLYEEKRKELEAFEQRKDTMEVEEYEREHSLLQLQVDERKRCYNQAAEEYRVAELEAP